MKSVQLLASALLLFSSVALADDRTVPRGFAISAGGGVNDFIGDDMREMTGTAGAWNLRGILGTRSYFAVEAAYVGSSQSIDSLGLDNDAILLSNGLNAAVRVNALLGALQPFVFGGAGWKHYDLARVETNTSSVGDSDVVLEVPVGVGIAYRVRGLVIDVRGTYRPVFGEDLVPGSNDEASSLDSYDVALEAGWEF